jgi:hypothetical protein
MIKDVKSTNQIARTEKLTIDWLGEDCLLLALTWQDTTAHKEPEIIKRK